MFIAAHGATKWPRTRRGQESVLAREHDRKNTRRFAGIASDENLALPLAWTGGRGEPIRAPWEAQARLVPVAGSGIIQTAGVVDHLPHAHGYGKNPYAFFCRSSACGCS
jgi:hypothetical protein